MSWHIIAEIARWVGFAFSLAAIIGQARAGAFRRIWNWPMRIGIICMLFFALLGWFGDWATHSHILSSSLVVILRDITLIAFSVGFFSLGIFLVGFLITMLRDFRSPSISVMAPLDSVQELILHGKQPEAIELYQKQMETGQAEAVEAVGQIAASLKAGLRV